MVGFWLIVMLVFVGFRDVSWIYPENPRTLAACRQKKGSTPKTQDATRSAIPRQRQL